MNQIKLKKDLAQKNLNDSMSLYFLSLFYRYNDEYDLEKEIITRALQIDSMDEYMRNRELWHKKATFHYDQKKSKVVPRPKYSNVNEIKPSDKILDQLCFVSACDSNNLYFEFLIELIESVKATKVYKNVPFYVLDLGLSDEQKHILSSMANGIKEAHWSIVFNPTPPNYRKCIIERAFLEKYFPNHQYYFWIDADSWIQNEGSFHAFLDMCAQHGIAAGRTGHSVNFISDGGLAQHKLPPVRWRPDLFAISPHVWGSSVCYKKNSLMAQTYQDTMREIAPLHGQPFWVDQTALNLIFIENEIKPLDVEHACPIGNIRDAFVKNAFDKYTLFAPHCSNPIGIVGVHHKQNHSENNEIYEVKEDNTLHTIRGSVRYRVWPWEDKDWVYKEMLKVNITN